MTHTVSCSTCSKRTKFEDGIRCCPFCTKEYPEADIFSVKQKRLQDTLVSNWETSGLACVTGGMILVASIVRLFSVATANSIAMPLALVGLVGWVVTAIASRHVAAKRFPLHPHNPS